VGVDAGHSDGEGGCWGKGRSFEIIDENLCRLYSRGE
jgi:hypothetical protein